MTFKTAWEKMKTQDKAAVVGMILLYLLNLLYSLFVSEQIDNLFFLLNLGSGILGFTFGYFVWKAGYRKNEPNQWWRILWRFLKNGFSTVIILGILIYLLLAYFGILNPLYISLSHSRCYLPSGLYCPDYLVTKDEMAFIIENGWGKDIIIHRIVVNESSHPQKHNCDFNLMLDGNGSLLSYGQSMEIHSDSCNYLGLRGGRYHDYTIILTYSLNGSDLQSVEGLVRDRLPPVTFYERRVEPLLNLLFPMWVLEVIVFYIFFHKARTRQRKES